MKRNVTLTVTSLLSILLFTLHVSDDIVRGIDKISSWNLIGVTIFVVWLYGILALGDRRSGYIIMLLVSIFGTGIPILHMTGAGFVGGRVAPNSSGAFFWVWQNFALCVISIFSFILSVRGLRSLRRGQSR